MRAVRAPFGWLVCFAFAGVPAHLALTPFPGNSDSVHLLQKKGDAICNQAGPAQLLSQTSVRTGFMCACLLSFVTECSKWQMRWELKPYSYAMLHVKSQLLDVALQAH